MFGPAQIDGLEFARSGKQLQATIEVRTLERLRDYLYDDTGVVKYDLRGALDREGKPVLDISVTGILQLRCQRCLEQMQWQIDIAKQLLLVEDAATLTDPAEEDETVDSLLAGQVGHVDDLVEEEILLSLPISPRHPSGTCGSATEGDNARTGSPFAVLAQLKTRAR